MDSIENSTDSLHHRRSLIIKDEISMTLWIIHGSGVAKKTKASAENQAGIINENHDGNFKIKRPEYNEAKEIVESILSQKGTTKTKKETKKSKDRNKKLSPIPKTPNVPKVNSSAPKPKGDDISSGPEIKEFQIAYYEDEAEKDVDAPLMKQVLLIISKYVREVDDIIKSKPSRKTAKKTLDQLSEEILDIVY